MQLIWITSKFMCIDEWQHFPVPYICHLTRNMQLICAPHRFFQWCVIISTPIHWFQTKLHAVLLKDAQLFLLLCTNFEPFAIISSRCLHLQLPMPPSLADINNNNYYFYSFEYRVNTSYGLATSTTCINTNVKWTTATTTATSISYLKF